MKRPVDLLTRRQLIKSFGITALLLEPVLRSMAYAAESTHAKAPRYVMFFKGGAYYPSRMNPTNIHNLAGTPIAPLQAHADDILLFKGMNIHSGSPKTNGYKEEHAGGLYGCVTGNSYKYFKSDAYFAYTDHESIDVAIANHYKTNPLTKDLPLAHLHLGAGAHSDADQVGEGNRYTSFRARQPGDSGYWGNAIKPIQDSGEVYDTLMRAASALCSKQSNQPRGDAAKLEAATIGGKSRVTDFLLQNVRDAKSRFGMDKEHASKFDALLEDFSQAETSARRGADAAKAPAATRSKSCDALARPTGNGAKLKNLDQLSPVHDQMISLIKLAFELDLTRVVAFTLSGASSGQTWPSRGVHMAHHELEHKGNVDGLVKIDTYYSEKFAGLLTALKSINDGGGKTALYNSSVFLGMECWSNSSSNHYLTNIPFVFAGQGGGRFKTGSIVEAKGRNNNDIHTSCLNAAGIKTDTFGLASLCQKPIIPTVGSDA